MIRLHVVLPGGQRLPFRRLSGNNHFAIVNWGHPFPLCSGPSPTVASGGWSGATSLVNPDFVVEYPHRAFHGPTTSRYFIIIFFARRQNNPELHSKAVPFRTRTTWLWLRTKLSSAKSTVTNKNGKSICPSASFFPRIPGVRVVGTRP